MLAQLVDRGGWGVGDVRDVLSVLAVWQDR